MGWTLDEQLLVITEQGTLYIYNLQGESKMVSLGEDAQQFGILDAIINNFEIIILTGNYKFIAILNFNDPRLRGMSSIGLNGMPDSWSIIPSDGQHSELLVAYQNTIYQLNMVKAIDQVILID